MSRQTIAAARVQTARYVLVACELAYAKVCALYSVLCTLQVCELVRKEPRRKHRASRRKYQVSAVKCAVKREVNLAAGMVK